QSFQLTMPSGGFAGAIMKPWDERERPIFPIQEELATKTQAVAGIRAPVFLRPALPSAGFFPVEFVLASTQEHIDVLRVATQLADEATASGVFAFPPILDVKIDQGRTEIVIDRDKVATMGLSMQQIGADLESMLGGNFVNRFNLAGRSYKVIPQVERIGRLTTEQIEDIYVSGPNGELVPLPSFATLQPGVEPRSLNRFQQLNSVKVSGVAARSLESTL